MREEDLIKIYLRNGKRYNIQSWEHKERKEAREFSGLGFVRFVRHLKILHNKAKLLKDAGFTDRETKIIMSSYCWY